MCLNNSIFNLGKKREIKKQGELDKKLVFRLLKARIPKLRQVKYIPHFLNKKEVLLIRILLGVILISLVFLSTRFYLYHLKIYPKTGGTYIEGLIGQPKFINPVLNGTNEGDKDIKRLIFSSLFKYNQDQRLGPDIVSSYTISSDQKTYTLFLKNNILWHDGEKLTTKDVAFTIDLIKNPETKSYLFSSLKSIKTEIIDDYTIKLILPGPYSPLLSLLTFGILPEHLWVKIPVKQITTSAYNLHPIGSGPFKFKSLDQDGSGTIKSITLERNKEYYKQVFLDNVILKFYPNPEEALSALKNKNIDGLVYLSKDGEEKINGYESIKEYQFYLPQYTALFINQKNNPFLEEVEIRKALALSLDKEKIVSDALDGMGEIIDSLILPGRIGYYPGVTKYDFNPEEANNLLEKNGWKKNSSGKREKQGKELKIALTTIDQLEYKKTAEIIKKFWEEVGISVNLKLVSAENFTKEIIQPKSYEILLCRIASGPDPDPYPFWYSPETNNSGLNLSLFSNRKADQLLAEARIISDEKEREKRYQEFQDILAEKIPAIFLYNPSYNYFVSKKIKGIEIERLSTRQDRFNDIDNWYIEVKRRI